MDLDTFAALVSEALEGLPGEFLERLENIQVDVEEWPTDEELLEAGMEVDERDHLLGLYHGVPLTDRSSQYMAFPDRITVYMRPIVAFAGGDEAAICRAGAAHGGARDRPLLRHRRRPVGGAGRLLAVEPPGQVQQDAPVGSPHAAREMRQLASLGVFFAHFF